MQTDQKNWWYREPDTDAKQGPFAQKEIQALIHNKTIRGETLLWREGMPDWIEAAKVTGSAAAPVNRNPLAALSPDEAGKWYSKKNRLWLSLLFWPLTVYGVYKTKLLDLNTKRIIGLAAGGLLILGLLTDGNDNTEVGMAGRPSFVSYFDHSISSVEDYVKESMNDPDSYESVRWTLPVKNENGTWRVSHTFRGKNMLGGKVLMTRTFIITRNGKEVLDMY